MLRRGAASPVGPPDTKPEHGNRQDRHQPGERPRVVLGREKHDGHQRCVDHGGGDPGRCLPERCGDPLGPDLELGSLTFGRRIKGELRPQCSYQARVRTRRQAVEPDGDRR